jgi:3-oxoacyl-[acyl-carrier-protein] synthase-3
MVQTSDRWILERTGIRERRIAGEDETNVTMGRIALERAIANAGIDPAELEMLVMGTNTTEFNPLHNATSCINESLKNISCFDLQAGCTGFN